jgi:hypothetical protein
LALAGEFDGRIASLPGVEILAQIYLGQFNLLMQ